MKGSRTAQVENEVEARELVEHAELRRGVGGEDQECARDLDRLIHRSGLRRAVSDPRDRRDG